MLIVFYSKNLYNYANYFIRQEFINNSKWIRYKELDKMLQLSEPYKQLMSQPSQCTLQVLDRNWKSFFVAIKDWKAHPDKYLGRPKLPRYKDKNGRFTWFIKNNQSRIVDGYLTFQMRCFKGYKFKTHCDGRLISVRFVPHNNYYMLEIVYEIEVPDTSDRCSDRIASIDLGVNNFVTLTNNIGEQPIIINGKGIKSINQLYNKCKAKLQSELMIRHGKHWSKRLDVLNFKRHNKMKNFTHNASRMIVDYCLENNIDTLVCGYNKTWKQECSMSKENNQKFVYIPYEMFIKQIEYKCQNEGIKFILTEESYTSGTSFLDREIPCKEKL